jgi:hypothetical protein
MTDIKLEGTNIVIRTHVPPDTKLVTLESKGVFTDSTWKAIAQETNVAEGRVIFRLARFAENQFFRIRALQSNATPAQTLELSYVAAPVLATDGRPDASGDVVLRFKAEIDGSDRIIINREGAVWKHVAWRWPATLISINGVSWNPRIENIFAAPGSAKLLPPDVQFRSATVEVLQGRDVVACETSAHELVIYVNDTPSGSAPYEFQVRLSTTPARATVARDAGHGRLQIKATIDGSDRLTITEAGAHWEHKYWNWPTNVTLGGVSWTPSTSPRLPNQGATRFLPANLDFSTARVVSRQGRDLVAVETRVDALIIHFADNPNGSADYVVDIAFGNDR